MYMYTVVQSAGAKQCEFDLDKFSRGFSAQVM